MIFEDERDEFTDKEQGKISLQMADKIEVQPDLDLSSSVTQHKTALFSIPVKSNEINSNEKSDLDFNLTLPKENKPFTKEMEENIAGVWKRHLQFFQEVRKNTPKNQRAEQQQKWRQQREKSKIKIKGQIQWQQVKCIKSTMAHRGLTFYVVELKNKRTIMVDPISLHHYLPRMVLDFYDKQQPILERLFPGQQ